MLSDEWLSRYGLLENFNASVTRTGTRTRTRTGTGTWTTGVTAIALCTSCSRAKNESIQQYTAYILKDIFAFSHFSLIQFVSLKNEMQEKLFLNGMLKSFYFQPLNDYKPNFGTMTNCRAPYKTLSNQNLLSLLLGCSIGMLNETSQPTLKLTYAILIHRYLIEIEFYTWSFSIRLSRAFTFGIASTFDLLLPQ